VAVSLDEMEVEDVEAWESFVRPEGEVEGRLPRGVAGTIVCVEVVEREEEDDEEDEGAGE